MSTPATLPTEPTTTVEKTVKTALWVAGSAAVAALLEYLATVLAGGTFDPVVVALGAQVLNVVGVFTKNFFDKRVPNTRADA